MSRIDRRRFVQLSGAGALTAGSGGLPGILASGRAPAYAQGTTVHWLRWSDFVPASDQLLRQKIVPQCQTDLGIKLNYEAVNANDIQARITSAVQSGSGPDVIMVLSTSPTSPKRSARSRAASTTWRKSSTISMANGSACRGRSAAA